jgi:hypothetical protein
VKELRLAQISDMESANKFLEEVYIPKHNAKFAVAPAKPYNAHRKLLKRHDLKRALCIKTVRTMANDYTLSYKKRFFQIIPSPQVRIRPGQKVCIEEDLSGSIRLTFRERRLKFKAIEKRPYLGYYAANKSVLRAMEQSPKGTSIPGKDHPWRKFRIKRRFAVAEKLSYTSLSLKIVYSGSY